MEAKPNGGDRIEALPEDVVNKIAAGEVVTRPAGVIKELLENALDAGATTIAVSVRQGGAKSMSIRDNGRGIRKDDFELLCLRFATSKIETFEDLKQCSTFGFRGEALAAVSQVSRLSVTSRRRDSPVAYKAEFCEGKMVSSASGEHPPRPCAGVEGTVMTVDDLFYNIPLRANALRSASEEYKLILEVVSRYAIRNAGVSITCRKITDAGTPSSSPPDVKTVHGATVKDNIKATFGKSLCDELLPVSLDLPHRSIKVSGYVSNANFNMRRSIAVLFINGRLVDCQPLKKGLELVFSPLLPKGSHPFMYLEVEMKAENVDVNVHPSKREVRFLYADELTIALSEAVSVALKGAQTSRVFYAQTVLQSREPAQSASPHTGPGSKPGTARIGVENGASKNTDDATVSGSENECVGAAEEDVALSGSKRKKSSRSGRSDGRVSMGTPANRRVRTDHRDQIGALDDFVTRATGSGRLAVEKAGQDAVDADSIPAERSAGKRRGRGRSSSGACLTSVSELRGDVTREKDEGLCKMLREHTFVGLVDEKFCLMQHRTKLMLVDLPWLLSEALYEEVLRGFSDFEEMAVSPAAPVGPSVSAYLECTKGVVGKENEAAVSSVCAVLSQHAAMLKEYFSVEVVAGSDGGALIASLPNVIDGHYPDLRLLPKFAVEMSDVCWEREKECLGAVAKCVGRLYAGWCGPEAGCERSEALRERAGMTRRFLVGQLRASVLPGSASGAVREIASLEKLYRVFERC